MGDTPATVSERPRGAAGGRRGPDAPRHRTPAPAAGPLGRAGTWLRVGATAAIGGLLLWGTFWGQDDHFPIGPLRQYSTSTDPNGLVWVTHAYGRFTDGEERALHEDDIGMRVAEFDGQFHRLREDPRLLRPLAETYHRRNPDGPRLVRLRVQRDAKKLEGREVVGRRTRIVAEIWVGPDGRYESTRLFGRFTNEDERRIDPLELGTSRATFDRKAGVPDPGTALLADLAAGWRRTNVRDQDKLVGLVLRRERVRIVDGEVVERTVEDLAELPL